MNRIKLALMKRFPERYKSEIIRIFDNAIKAGDKEGINDFPSDFIYIFKDSKQGDSLSKFFIDNILTRISNTKHFNYYDIFKNNPEILFRLFIRKSLNFDKYIDATPLVSEIEKRIEAGEKIPYSCFMNEALVKSDIIS